MDWSRWRAVVAVVALLLLAAGVSLRMFAASSVDANRDPSREARPRPNLLFILIDTLRADRVRGTSSLVARMPFLSSFASGAIFYERAYAPSSWTVPSVVSLFTAQYPSEHGVGRQWFQSRMSDSAETLAGVLTANGYTSIAVSAHAGINGGNCGRGFEQFTVVGKRGAFVRDADDVNAEALAWVQAFSASRKPWFLYLHYMDMHAPYRVHAGLTRPRSDENVRDDLILGAGTGAGARAATEAARREAWNYTPPEVVRLQELYDGEARYVDERLGVLFAELERQGALADTIVVITADHGEEFGGHGVFGHGASLYESVVRVPLIVKLPREPGARSDVPTQIAGIAPTLLRELDIAAPEGFHIAPFRLRGQAAETTRADRIYSELPQNNHLKLRLHDRAVVGSTEKLIVTSAGERLYFDLVADPGEQQALPSLPDAAGLDAALARMRPARVAPLAAPTLALDRATKERLRRLGYLD